MARRAERAGMDGGKKSHEARNSPTGILIISIILVITLVAFHDCVEDDFELVQRAFDALDRWARLSKPERQAALPAHTHQTAPVRGALQPGLAAPLAAALPIEPRSRHHPAAPRSES